MVKLCKNFALLRGHGAVIDVWFAIGVSLLLFGCAMTLLFVGFCKDLSELLLVEVRDEPMGEGTLMVVGYFDHMFFGVII